MSCAEMWLSDEDARERLPKERSGERSDELLAECPLWLAVCAPSVASVGGATVV